MSDANTSQPVRTEGDLQDKIQSKIVDYTDPSIGQIVDADGNSHVELHGNDPAGIDRVVRTSEIGALTPDGFYDAAANTKPGNVGLIASARNASPSDTTQTQRLTSVTNGTKRLLDMSLHDENGDAYSPTNPLAVTITATEGGVPLHNYSTAAAVVAAASSNHDYTVPVGKTLVLKSLFASASGKLKVELQIDADGVGAGPFASSYVGFNSVSSPNIILPFVEPIQIPAGGVVRVIRTNKDNQAQDLYSTLNGILV